jgi:hypothetical protein
MMLPGPRRKLSAATISGTSQETFDPDRFATVSPFQPI